jgi:hypothetical protein
MLRRWIEGILQGMLATILLALVPAAIVTYLAKLQSIWAAPVLLGLCAWALTSIIIVAMNALRHLPPVRVLTNTDNVESNVRGWLHNFRYAIQNAPDPTAYFRFVVKTDAGVSLTIGRPKGEFKDYIIIRHDLIRTSDDDRILGSLSDEERLRLVVEIRLELARARVGYNGLSLPLPEAGFSVFKRVPVNDTLTEDKFVSYIEDVEAAMNAVGAVFFKGIRTNQLASS